MRLSLGTRRLHVREVGDHRLQGPAQRRPGAGRRRALGLAGIGRRVPLGRPEPLGLGAEDHREHPLDHRGGEGLAHAVREGRVHAAQPRNAPREPVQPRVEGVARHPQTVHQELPVGRHEGAHGGGPRGHPRDGGRAPEGLEAVPDAQRPGPRHGGPVREEQVIGGQPRLPRAPVLRAVADPQDRDGVAAAHVDVDHALEPAGGPDAVAGLDGGRGDSDGLRARQLLHKALVPEAARAAVGDPVMTAAAEHHHFCDAGRRAGGQHGALRSDTP